MYLVKVSVKESVLNILLLLLSLLQAEISAATSQQSPTNVTVTRTPGAQDSFTFTTERLKNTNCSLRNPDICAVYGGIQGKEECKTEEFCCKPCTCVKERPTFLVHKRRCVEDTNITDTYGVGKAGHRFILDFPGSACSPQALTTLDTTAPGRLKFSICTESKMKVVRCTMSPKNSKYLDRNGSWIGLHDIATRRAIKHGFSVDTLQLKWQSGQQTRLQGSVVSLDVTCFEQFFMITGMQEYSINSQLLFKISGSQVWQGSNIFQQSDTANSTNQSSGSVVMPTKNTVSIATVVDSSTTDGKERRNIIHVSKVDILLVVVAAVLGSLLLMVIALACIAVVFYVRRKKKKIPVGNGTSNPLYERGPDMTLVQNGEPNQTSLYNSHFYQPLVENTREVFGVRGEPIYQSLDEQVRNPRGLSMVCCIQQNPNRCSLPYCDMTTDGYLVPADGHTYPEPPTATVSREDITEVTNLGLTPNTRLSYDYDQPGEIIPDHCSPLMVTLPTENDSDQESNYDDVNVPTPQTEQTKRFYYELEDSKETKISQEEEKTYCEECKGTIGNYACGENSKPVRCLCDVTTKL